MKQTELAWAAGFFDGEGTTSRLHTLPERRTSQATFLSISQKHPQVLRRFKKAIGGYGKIHGPLTKFSVPGSWIYQFRVTKTKSVDTILTDLWPYLSDQKRKQARKVGFRLGAIRNPKVGRPKGV